MTPVELIKEAYNGAGNKWIFWLSSALWLVLSTGMIYGLKSIVENDRLSRERHVEMIRAIGSLESRVSTIEGNRFTSHDANVLMQTILDKLPPQWLIDRVDENRMTLKELNKILNNRQP